MALCFVKNCLSFRLKEGIVIHNFPEVGTRRMAWFNVVGCCSLEDHIVHVYGICSLHFAPEDYTDLAKAQLKSEAVPSRNLSLLELPRSDLGEENLGGRLPTQDGCCACGCSRQKDKKLRLFQWPVLEPERLVLWARFSNRLCLVASTRAQNLRICSDHFDPLFYFSPVSDRLNGKAVPTLFQSSEILIGRLEKAAMSGTQLLHDPPKYVPLIVQLGDHMVESSVEGIMHPVQVLSEPEALSQSTVRPVSDSTLKIKPAPGPQDLECGPSFVPASPDPATSNACRPTPLSQSATPSESPVRAVSDSATDIAPETSSLPFREAISVPNHPSDRPLTPKSGEPVCRVCGEGNPPFIGIFSDEGQERQLLHKVHSTLPVQVQHDDGLPSQLCPGCTESVEAAFQLRERATHTDVALRLALLRSAVAHTPVQSC